MNIPSPRSVAVKTPLSFPDHWKIFAKKPAQTEPTEISPAPIAAAQTVPAPEVETKSPPKVRILIAEDDPVSCQLIVARLKSWNYEPVITRNGHEAMAVLSGEDSPAMAIVDWMMPGMDGLEVCRRVRSVNKAVYIILLTAMTGKDSLYEALEAGADDYIPKPFYHLELLGRICVGLRIIGLQIALAARVEELELLVGGRKDVEGGESNIPL